MSTWRRRGKILAPPRHARSTRPVIGSAMAGRPGRTGSSRGEPATRRAGRRREERRHDPATVHESPHRDPVRVAGPRKISVLAAILLKFTENALLRGDPRSATFLLNRYGQRQGRRRNP